MSVLLAVLVVAGCGGQGTRTECGPGGCTVTFPRGGTVSVSLLGVEARLVEVRTGTARLEIAGQQIALPVGVETEAGGLRITVERVTDGEVVVRVRP
ncbi:hypothetical protein SAMN05443637_12349 [Pseudonocardia thermophila]|jgi:hypothetical protein|uniref:Uncharacterized protein n=1 Tax=Pseudonocardia thermophila TaxID=1848 RepID=A0A1M6ZCT4_PSETH|nr:hypothetical protein [Pseudonocardia thermophila]SHL28288.1 hypothetical protein SAMN05443637_12349 [Pseudonocardia thermophila]